MIEFKDNFGHKLEKVTMDIKDTGRGYLGLYISGYCKKCKKLFTIDGSSLPMNIQLDKTDD